MSYAIAVAASLVALEVASRAASLRFLRQDPFRIRRWTFLAGASAAAAVAVSFLQHILWDGLSISLLAGGAGLFAVGWAIRYPALLRLWSWEWPPKLDRLMVSHSWSGARHPRYAGLCLEVLGVAVALSSWVGAVVAVTVVPVSVWVALELDERWMMAKYPQSGVDYLRRHESALWPGSRRSIQILVLALLAAITAAVLSRELQIFVSDLDTAKTLLLALAGAQGTLGVLAITAAFAIGQVISGSYSASIAQGILSRRLLLVGLAWLGISAIYDILMLARADSWLVDDESIGRWVDFGLLLALLSFPALWVSMLSSFEGVQPETLAARLLRSLDQKWIERIKADWPARFTLILRADDPFRHYEAILRSLMARDDLLSARLILVELRDRLSSILDPEDMIAFDEYFNFQFRHLIRLAARTSNPEILEGILDINEGIPSPSHSSLRKRRPGLAALIYEPKGEQVVRTVLSEALEHGLEDVAISCIHSIGRRMTSLLKALPDEKETYSYDPDFDPYPSEGRPPDISKEERRRRQDADDFVRWISGEHANYLQEQAAKAIAAGSLGASWAVSSGFASFASSAVDEVRYDKMRSRLVSDALYGLRSIADAAARSGKTWEGLGPLYLSQLSYIPERLDPTIPSDRQLMTGIVETGAYCLRALVKSGIRRSGIETDVAMIGLHAAEKCAEAARPIIEAMRDAAILIKAGDGFEEDRDLQYTYKELIGRIRGVGFSGRGKGAEELREFAKGVVKQLEEGGDESVAPHQ